MYTKRRCAKINADCSAAAEGESECETVTEFPVTIFVNGREAVTAMASPGMLKEYAIGFLMTESVIKNPDEIESIHVQGNKVSIITLNPRKILFSKKTALSGCGGTSAVIDYSTLPCAPEGEVFTAERIRDAVSEIKSCEINDKTGEIYFAGIFTASETVVKAFDIGRDNALDKAIGAASLEKTDLGRCFAVVSGRISSEMVRKCLFIQIPVIVSCGGITSLACDIAIEGKMTLAASVNPQEIIVYSGDHRIAGEQNWISPNK